MQQALHYDVAICGAGPVGLALAALLVRRGVAGSRIALIDGKSLGQAITDPRSIALSWGSRELLQEAGAWPVAATAIHDIHISRRGQFGRTLMQRSEHGLEALGYVTRYGAVVDALAQACDRASITMLRPARVNSIEERADGASLLLDDGRSVQCQIAVQSEGGVFGQQAPRARQHDYQQSAVIARVSVEHPIAQRAFERFTDVGPLALLPEDGPDGHQYALVWCVPPERASQVLALGEAEFLQQLGQAFGERMGRFTGASKRLAFPLGLNAEARASARSVAIGNAAQTLHPVAGQGLNLGLRDAAVLARQLARGCNSSALQGFMQERERDRKLTINLTDSMARVFASAGPLQPLLGLGLSALDMVRPARTMLAELMMYGDR